MDPTPSVLLAVWPSRELPALSDLDQLMAPHWVACPSTGEDPPPDMPDALWTRAYEWRPAVGEDGAGLEAKSAFGTAPLIFWVSSMKSLPLAAELALRPGGDALRKQLRRAKWVLGSVALLDARDPLASWQAQLRTLLLAAPQASCIYDGGSTALWTASDAQAVAAAQASPRPSCLYRVHVVLPDDPRMGTWVHTHGLQRAGFPDVELLGVPGSLGAAGAELLHQFVASYLGGALPKRGRSFSFIPGYPLAWLPWREAVRQQEAVGGVDEMGRRGRETGGGATHGGYRIVLVEADERGVRVPWRAAPLALLQALDGEDVVTNLSVEETRRRRQMAVERWPALQQLLHQHLGAPGWDFLVQLAYPVQGEQEGGREHLWFELLQSEDARVLARLVNTPLWVPSLREGELGWHDIDLLVDWEIHGPEGTIRPDTTSL